MFNEVFEFLKGLFFTIIYCLCVPGEFRGKGFTRKIMLQAPEFKYLLAVADTLFQRSFQSRHR